jgi:hypothetical protein
MLKMSQILRIMLKNEISCAIIDYVFLYPNAKAHLYMLGGKK